MFFVNGHFCNSTIVGWTYWQCVFFLNASHETIPRRSLANSLATYLHPPVWSSPMCLMVWLPSQRCQPQDRVETTGSIWKSEPHIYIYTRSIFYILFIMIYIYTNNNSNNNSNNSMNKYHKIILYTDSIYFHISSFKRSWYMMICNLLSPNLHYNYDSITCFFADLCVLLRGPICQPWRMGSDLGLHGFLRGLPGTDPRNWCVCWRLWIQGVDLFWPGWENQKA